MYNLGQIHLHGGPVEATEAAYWFRQAANLSHTFAQHNLGGMYLYGAGVPLNYILAHMWFEIAYINGDDKGARSMEAVEKLMIPSDISEARRLVRVCMDSNYLDCG